VPGVSVWNRWSALDQVRVVSRVSSACNWPGRKVRARQSRVQARLRVGSTGAPAASYTSSSTVHDPLPTTVSGVGERFTTRTRTGIVSPTSSARAAGSTVISSAWSAGEVSVATGRTAGAVAGAAQATAAVVRAARIIVTPGAARRGGGVGMMAAHVPHYRRAPGAVTAARAAPARRVRCAHGRPHARPPSPAAPAPDASAVARARAALARAERLVVFTGAGVSAESGVPTFRGAGGLWRSFRPEELATPRRSRAIPRLVWEWYAWRRDLVRGCAPNAAHRAIARWAAGRAGVTIVTQNVDGLHQRAAAEGGRSDRRPRAARIALRDALRALRLPRARRPRRGRVVA
jgi:hypothetical protein